MPQLQYNHTPGPWQVTSRGGHDYGSAVFSVPQVCTNIQREADAHLISAAPDLLEALRALDEAYCRVGTHLTREERFEDRKRLIAARAAVAKALGVALA